MVEKEITRKVKVLRKLARLFNREDRFDEEMIDIYIESLEDMTADTFEKVAKWLAKRNKFMPSVAEMYEAIELMEEEKKESPEYQKAIGKVVTWMEDNRGWDYATGLCDQNEVDEALVNLGMEAGSVNARDI